MSAMKLVVKQEHPTTHVWVGVFSGKDPDHLGKNGDLCFRPEEWEFFKEIMYMNWAFGSVDAEGNILLLSATLMLDESYQTPVIRQIRQAAKAMGWF